MSQGIYSVRGLVGWFKECSLQIRKASTLDLLFFFVNCHSYCCQAVRVNVPMAKHDTCAFNSFLGLGEHLPLVRLSVTRCLSCSLCKKKSLGFLVERSCL